MTKFRLLNIAEERLESFDLENHPPYLAASHTWSENIYPRDCAFSQCFAGRGIKASVRKRHPTIDYCWFDTVCIDQSDEQDKLDQIPLMDRIFGEAECVVVFISSHIGATQHDVDWLTAKLDGALAMCLAEAWKEEGDYWQSAAGRQWLLLGKQCLLRLASTAWATRIWTLQEFVLAKAVLWVGLDLCPIQVDDYLISALPDICNTLAIEECLAPEFKVLDSHFAGMANARLQNIDRTRIMELPGNRKATVPVDEVYGCMAASGVIVKPIRGETETGAWARWCEEAVRQGNIRWILLPVSSSPFVDEQQRNCTFPHFSNRHELSGCSGLDTVKPLGPVTVSKGSVTASARLVGSVRIVRRLGRVHEPRPGNIHRDITLIFFAEGKWSLALKLVWTFGAGRYNTRQARVIAQVLVQSYARALRTVVCHREDSFEPVLSSNFQRFVWNDFLALQQSRMLALNVGEAYLCQLELAVSGSLKCLAVAVFGQKPPITNFSVLDFEADASDGRPVLMIVQHATMPDASPTFHKLGMTIGISEDVAKVWSGIPLQRVHIGGLGCSECQVKDQGLENGTERAIANMKHLRGRKVLSRIRMMERQQERLRFKLFAGKAPHKTHKRKPSSQIPLRLRQTRKDLERCQTRFASLMEEVRQRVDETCGARHHDLKK